MDWYGFGIVIGLVVFFFGGIAFAFARGYNAGWDDRTKWFPGTVGPKDSN